MSEARELKEKASQFFGKGKFAKAAEAYEAFCAIDRKDHQARLRAGDAWSKAGRKDKAATSYAQAAEGFARDGFLPRAIAASKLVLELEPAHKATQKMLAELYAQKSSARPRSSPAGLMAVAPLEVSAVEPPADHSQNEDAIEIEPELEAASGPAALSETSIEIELSIGGPVTGEVEIPIEGTLIGDEAPSYELELSPTAAQSALERHESDAEASAAHARGLLAQAVADRAAAEQIAAESAAVRAAAARDAANQRAEAEASAAAARALLERARADRAEAERLAAQVASDSEAQRAEVEKAHVDRVAAENAAAEAEKRHAEIKAGSASADERAAAANALAARTLLGKAASIEPSNASSLPPGLKPKRADTPPISRIWIPPAAASALSDASDIERGLEAFTRFDPDVTARPTTSAFTELDLEGDTMLHNVIAAAPFSSSPSALEELPDESEPGSLPRIPLFSDLPPDAFIALFEQCPLLRFEKGQLVFGQGDVADAFFVICAGSARVYRTDGGEKKNLATIEEGSFFGEMALLSGALRSASVEAATEDTQVLAISREVLTRLSAEHPSVARALKKFARQRMLTNLMNNAPLFSPFNRSDRRDLVQKFRARDVGQGEVVLREGAQSDGLYVVLSGEVEVEIEGQQVALLKEGELFGEMSMLTRSPASATIRALRHTSLLRLPRQDFDTIILSHPQVLEYVSVLIDQRRSGDRSRSSQLV